MLENPGIPLPFSIQTVSLKDLTLDLKFKFLDEIVYFIKYISPSTTAQYKQHLGGWKGPVLSKGMHYG
ncbi:hypothetical protein FOXYSP1_20600 [Fusarium oxysporum f. sp. phaseoli]